MIDLTFYKGKRVFITGNTGFKGTWLCAVLNMLGANVYGYSHKKYDFYKMCELDKSINTKIADIRDKNVLKRQMSKFEPEIVFHLAAQPLVMEGYHSPVYTYETNVMGTVNILEAVSSCKSVKAVVNVTTDKVYQNIDSNKAYKENDRICGIDPYSNSKSCSELITFSYINSFFKDDDSNINLATARAGNVIGGGDFAENRIIPDCIKAAEKGETIIVRNKSSIRPWQHVLDPLVGYLILAKALFNGSISKTSFNFGPSENNFINVGELVDLFCSMWGNGAKWDYKPDPNTHLESKTLTIDSSLAKKLLKWSPVWDAEKAVAMTVKFHKDIASGKPAKLIMNEQINGYLSYL
jgi:CDP-glucose 4,6-dehydratase